MNNWFYTKLAFSNLKKNSKTYIPYLFTCCMTVMMFYIMKSLSQNPGIEQLIGDKTLYMILNLGSYVVGLFSFIFLFYTNSFLMKSRQKEFGVFHILGMEKRHLAKVILLESIFVMGISLSVGIIFGIALDKAMFLVIAKMVGASIPLGFFISGKVIRTTVIFFLLLFSIILLKSVTMLRISNPVELLHGGNKGEKEPKTRWILAILGVVGMAAGYYIALTTKNPVASINSFFIAVILVILSTYLVFMAGSIALLKLLKRNKSYYYKTTHFISVSGMIYRMKQNAVGLANICVLSTMVLVMVSTTTSMMVGFKDILMTRYPSEIAVYSDEVEESHNKEIVDMVTQLRNEFELPVENEIKYSYLSVAAIRRGDVFITTPEDVYPGEMQNVSMVAFTTLEDYNAIMGESKTLGENEVFVYSNRDRFSEDTLHILNKEYKVAGVLDSMYENGEMASNILSTLSVVLPDMDALKEINILVQKQHSDLGLGDQLMHFYYGFDTSATTDTEARFYSQLKTNLSELGYHAYSEDREGNRAGMLGVYGGLFFLGIFLGVLFIMATVLIIYYKQISEGYEDRERFAIMQKVGLNQSEVKSAIRSQVLTVFFLPLVVAGIHLMAAFPVISKLLSLLNMQNTTLYIGCAVTCFAIFALVYIGIYSLTAKTYYKIVSNQ